MDDLDKCSRTCWIVGAVVGLVVLFLLFGLADYGFIWALIWALILGLLAGFLLQYFLCQKNADAVDRQAHSSEATPVSPSSQAPQPAVSPEPAVEPSAANQPEPVAEQESTPTEPSDAHEIDKGGVGPPTLSAARGGAADDLKRIKGIGPKLEASLNELGFYHFDQIAAWSDSDVDWADEKFGGTLKRVRRDDWVAQARTLAEGGDTDFSKKVDKGDYY